MWALVIAAAVVLGFLVLPSQAAAMESPGFPAARLGMTAGLFNLLWAVVVVLMVVRPGSTTGA